MEFKKYDNSTWQPIMPKKLKGIPYTGALPATLTGTKAGYLHKYKIFGNVGENLLEIEPGMLDEANWVLASPYYDATYFMYYLFSEDTTERLKRIGNIAGTVYLIAGGSYYQGEVLAITSSIKSTVTVKERLLQNNGTPMQYSANASEYSNIYLCIGHGRGVSSSNKQLLIDSFFNNYNIMLNAGTVPLPYEPYEKCGEKTQNLFDLNRQRSNAFVLDSTKYIYGARADHSATDSAFIKQFVYNNDSFTVLSTGGAGIGFLIEVKPNTTYTVSYKCDVTVPDGRTSGVFNLITSNGTFGAYWAAYGDNRSSTFTTDANTAYVYLVFRVIDYSATYSNIMLIEDSTALPYEPFGYKLPLTSAGQNIEIYIGDDTLSDIEYVDSGTGKIYRMVDGALTPTDPPVPFPQIPASAGSTTISWAGEGLAPSEFDSIQEWADIPTYTYTNGEWVADNQQEVTS